MFALSYFNLSITLYIKDGLPYGRALGDNFTIVYFDGEITLAIITTLICSIYAVTLLSLALYSHFILHHPEVWWAGVRDFKWLGRPAPAGDVGGGDTRKPGDYTRATRCFYFICGESRGLGVEQGFYRPLSQFFSNHTVFRRVVGVEPVWLAFTRGVFALAFLVGLLAYGTIQCIKLPVWENASNLPVRSQEIQGAYPYVPLTSSDITFVRGHNLRSGNTQSVSITARSSADLLQQFVRDERGPSATIR